MRARRGGGGGSGFLLQWSSKFQRDGGCDGGAAPRCNCSSAHPRSALQPRGAADLRRHRPAPPRRHRHSPPSASLPPPRPLPSLVPPSAGASASPPSPPPRCPPPPPPPPPPPSVTCAATCACLTSEPSARTFAREDEIYRAARESALRGRGGSRPNLLEATAAAAAAAPSAAEMKASAGRRRRGAAARRRRRRRHGCPSRTARLGQRCAHRRAGRGPRATRALNAARPQHHQRRHDPRRELAGVVGGPTASLSLQPLTRASAARWVLATRAVGVADDGRAASARAAAAHAV